MVCNSYDDIGDNNLVYMINFLHVFIILADMVQVIYIIILAYFILGAIGFYFINKKKDHSSARKSRVKFITYFLIIHILFFSIVIKPVVFRFLAGIIIIAGFYEIFKLHKESGFIKKRFFLLSALIFAVLAYSFFIFSGMDKNYILFAFLVISIFDSFSQITGQIFGRKKIFPKISPAKTVEGLAGGFIVTLISSLLFQDLIVQDNINTLKISAGISAFAFIGDLAASYYKRMFKVKDFSNLIPGHGGFLDRFDSFIAGGAWVAISTLLLNI